MHPTVRAIPNPAINQDFDSSILNTCFNLTKHLGIKSHHPSSQQASEYPPSTPKPTVLSRPLSIILVTHVRHLHPDMSAESESPGRRTDRLLVL